MSIKVGGTFGICLLWRGKMEQRHDDCVGAKKKQVPSVMCWRFIMWNHKGPFYVWDTETEAARKIAAIEILKLNTQYDEEETRLNKEWKDSLEWRKLKEHELQRADEIRMAAKVHGEKSPKTTQSWRGKKHKSQKLNKGIAVELIHGDIFNMCASPFYGLNANH